MMKKKLLTGLQFSILLISISFLFGFAQKRNIQRGIDGIEVEFIQEQAPYISEQMVNKLLKQNSEQIENVHKEILDLNMIERKLDLHPMIEDSDVYLTVNKHLKAKILQRTPIARVHKFPSFYIDIHGNRMPLSKNYSAHVPFVYGLSNQQLKEIFPLLSKIKEDEFLNQHVVGITVNENENYVLKFRVFEFDIVFGKIQDLDKKIKNLKAFYQKMEMNDISYNYKKINLQFTNQVVCTLK